MATPAATITMTMREADRLKTVQAVVDRMLRVGQAAQRLGMSRRQVERLVDRYVDEGPSGLGCSEGGEWRLQRVRAEGFLPT
jgi:transcriptional regulator GlxA family with amidase domain